jgi:hypothetical protein
VGSLNGRIAIHPDLVIKARIYSKLTKAKRVGNVAQVVECLPNPNTIKTNKKQESSNSHPSKTV